MKTKKVQQHKTSLQVFNEYLKALVFAFFMAVIIRSFWFEPFKIPSPSMVPTLLVGDHIFVKRYAYGWRIPMTKTWITEFGEPQRGDVVVFTETMREKEDYIKRVIGLPGDKIAMKDDMLSINGEPAQYQDVAMNQRSADNACDLDVDAAMPEDFLPFPHYTDYQGYKLRLETLPGTTKPHLLQQRIVKDVMHQNTDFEIIVPPRHYFVMGDNRDNSSDSRFELGPVPRENLKGKAVKIWLSMNHEGGACSYDAIYGWFGPVVDAVFGVVGWHPFDGEDPSPSVRWNRFWRDIL